jgi:hypothetical protein
MKNLSIAFIFLMMLLTTNIFAQSKDKTVPETVVSALKQKYPDATFKSWKIKGNLFTAKINIGGKKCFATFDEHGSWINTTSKISWPWSLPLNIRSAYKKSDYSTWNIYVSKKIESPAGEFYELMVNNNELINHFPSPEDEIATNKLLKFKANGTLAAVTDISDNPTLKF